MHFFYLDESGDTGENLNDQEQPIFVLAGISIADEKWVKTQEAITEIYRNYFEGNIPDRFELHATDILCRNGDGVFAGHDITRRLNLVDSVLALLEDRGHDVHYFAIQKSVLLNTNCQYNTVYNNRVPYFCSFDYLITYINWHMKTNLGTTSRGLIVLDEKKELQGGIEAIIHNRRFDGAQAHRIKRIVEFSYPIDSKKDPMVQFSDLIALCVRRFLEMENGYHDEWNQEMKNKYAQWYSLIDNRVKRKGIVERIGRNAEEINNFKNAIQCKPRRNWKRFYNIAGG